MDPLLTLLIFAGGLVAGIMNTVAGGGSLLTLPLLIFSGLPAGVANGTNRLAIVVQNVAAAATFHGKGVRFGREAWLIQLPLLVGAAVGVKLAIGLDDAVLRRVIGLALVVMLVPLLRRRGPARRGPARIGLGWWVWPVYLALGVYGGFLQAGIGFFLLAMLVSVDGLGLVQANAVKVFWVLGYSILAVFLFAAGGQFALAPALALAAGNMVGGWVGAHFAVEKGERWIRWVLAISVGASALKLTGVLEWAARLFASRG